MLALAPLVGGLTLGVPLPWLLMLQVSAAAGESTSVLLSVRLNGAGLLSSLMVTVTLVPSVMTGASFCGVMVMLKVNGPMLTWPSLTSKPKLSAVVSLPLWR